MAKIGISHPQGYGKLVKIGCKVKFDFIVPLDLKKTPWVLFSLSGHYTHQLPPLTHTPQELLQGLLDVITRLKSSTLTYCKYSLFNI